MQYGEIEFSRNELCFLVGRMKAALARVDAAIGNATCDDERDFYASARKRLRLDIAQTEALESGRHGFSEEGLNRLRAALVEERHGDLARRCVEARRTNDTGLGKLESDYLVWTTLCAKLERPFMYDRSQDAESEEDGDTDCGTADTSGDN